MTFNPNSTIYLCNVPIDSTYQNQIYFANASQQIQYFSSKVVKTLTQYLTVRKTLPDGSMQSSIKVDANIDVLQSLCVNYMYYQNNHHGTKYFFAFITKLIYINEGTTEIVFETDVYQTWLFNVQLKPSYVVREHSVTDTVASNVTPEKFNFQDYVYEEAVVDSELDDWGYLVGSTELNFDSSSTSAGHLMSGIFQGLYFYYYENTNDLSDFLASQENDNIQFICVIPKFCVKANEIGANESDKEKGQGFLYSSEYVASHQISFQFNASKHLFNGYTPKNNKLYTSPFIKLIVTNHNGEQAEYNIEDFSYNTSPEIRDIEFIMKGDVSANPSITLIPQNYKGIADNYDCGISISGFPQCSFSSDTFKLWLAKNQYGVALDTIGDLGQIVAGVVMTAGSGGTAGAIGVTQIVSGATGVLNTVNNVYKASKEPNKAHSGSAKNNLLTAIGKNKFSFYWQRIQKEYAKTVDDFFTMYGYATNLVKVPNVSSRPYFNYVQTIDVNIVGGIPSQDMEILKSIYNRGVTLWKHTATVGDYSVDNSPS